MEKRRSLKEYKLERTLRLDRLERKGRVLAGQLAWKNDECLQGELSSREIKRRKAEVMRVNGYTTGDNHPNMTLGVFMQRLEYRRVPFELVVSRYCANDEPGRKEVGLKLGLREAKLSRAIQSYREMHGRWSFLKTENDDVSSYSPGSLRRHVSILLGVVVDDIDALLDGKLEQSVRARAIEAIKMLKREREKIARGRVAPRPKRVIS